MGQLFMAKAWRFEWTEFSDVGQKEPYISERSALVVAETLDAALACWKRGHSAHTDYRIKHVHWIDADSVYLSGELGADVAWPEEA